MSAPKSVRIKPDHATDFYVVCETEHVVEYKFWVQPKGGQWSPIGPEHTNDEKADHWIFMPPMPDGSVFAYWLGVWGNANTKWKARLQILQRDPADATGTWVVRGDWTEEGTTSDEHNGGGVSTIPSIPRVTLNS